MISETDLSNLNIAPDYSSIDVNEDKPNAWIKTNYDLGNNIK
jgi:hypothetical protein